MPRVASLLMLGLVLTAFAAGGAAGQSPAQSGGQVRWGDRPVSPPQIPWTGGTAVARPVEPPRLLPAGYQSPPGGASNTAAYRRQVRTVGGQQPLPLPPQPGGVAAPGAKPQLPPLVTGAASLGIVLGLFLLVVWSVRRGMPRGSGILPSGAVEVLGRAPIAGRQNVHLVRCGNKIVLLSITATSVETLTEISDPDEVDRLRELCRQTSAPATAWQHLMGRLGNLGQGVDIQERRPDQIDFGHLEVGTQTRA